MYDEWFNISGDIRQFFFQGCRRSLLCFIPKVGKGEVILELGIYLEGTRRADVKVVCCNPTTMPDVAFAQVFLQK